MPSKPRVRPLFTSQEEEPTNPGTPAGKKTLKEIASDLNQVKVDVAVLKATSIQTSATLTEVKSSLELLLKHFGIS